ncbi:haloacid dehalogenase, type II [Kwoniella mangroviensis CBS 10435]|uniref:Haloacid dehalogenase, type II n=1 Tax=Kwoniella mangroviensis CBS 10435 TaxID=1331196 RepID=A0A1B9ING9_9TREE|nr:haloacid dehalogenase, type II [Kwoniella mangroviensis CBS 8507]OCF56920.1 haloacid dehalogenase, type II [Kwoniella mangroviensis CBS 10435]OCF67357.1 haloacid dehalogenase, type II [Kwoniella mangroviensis CBS 8507]
MTLTICCDALGTCFTLQDIVKAVEERYGEGLAKKAWGCKGFVMDWFHSAQRDYTYLSLISPPPPPIASILKTSLPLSLSAALSIPPPKVSELEGITSLLSSLPAAPTLKEAFSYLANKEAKLAIITNGAKSTTEEYASKAGIIDYISSVVSCDDVGYAKPHKEVYEAANSLCERLEEGGKGQRWFVAAHLWDLAAAKKAGFKTGLVVSDLPPELVDNDKQDEGLSAWYETYGGRPDIVGKSLLEVAQEIIERH